ncbi:MAG: hypothetical protein JW888_10100 [Pirellulales bacterium]|nr:hypothetical protein [Pirellulales bacterium]
MKTKLPEIPYLAFVLLVACTSQILARDANVESSTRLSHNRRSPANAFNSGAKPQTDAMLADSIATLEGYHSIAAELGCRVDLFGKQLGGTGNYREERSGPFPKVRVELRMPLGEKMGVLVQVCDGRYLWSYRRLLNEEKLTRVDMQRLAQELGSGNDLPLVSPLTSTIGMGGLAGTLRELRRNFHFEVLGETRLLDEPVWQLRGRWLPDRLVAILPDQKKAIDSGKEIDYSKLPPHLPSHVMLTLGQEDLFPYRVEYRRSEIQEGPDGPRDSPEARRSGMVIQFLRVAVNSSIRPAEFDYNAVDFSDVTESYIARLKARAAATPKTKP